MAFQTAASGSSSSNVANDSWKADGFINLYLPSANGAKRRKLGAIPLKGSKPSEKELLAYLNEDPTRVANILSKLVMEYQSVTPAEGTGFDLS